RVRRHARKIESDSRDGDRTGDREGNAKGLPELFGFGNREACRACYDKAHVPTKNHREEEISCEFLGCCQRHDRRCENRAPDRHANEHSPPEHREAPRLAFGPTRSNCFDRRLATVVCLGRDGFWRWGGEFARVRGTSAARTQAPSTSHRVAKRRGERV